MVTNFKGATHHGWLRALQTTLILLLLGAMSVTTYAAKTDEDKNTEGDSFWVVMVMTPDIMATSREVGGEWIAIQNLPLSGIPDSEFDGWILRSINSAAIHKKEVLHKIIKDDYEIVDHDTWENIPLEVFKEMPTTKILSVAIMPNPKDGKVTARVILNKEDYKKNPFMEFATDLNVTTCIRLWNIVNEPGFR